MSGGAIFSRAESSPIKLQRVTLAPEELLPWAGKGIESLCSLPECSKGTWGQGLVREVMGEMARDVGLVCPG